MNAERWLLTSHPAPNAPWQLFCLPHAGGGGSAYTRWGRQLEPDVEVSAVCLPGRERHVTAAPIAEMDALVTGLLDVVREAVRGPFALFGHSFGALVGFELGRRLGRTGCEPGHLFVSSAIPPHLARLEPALWDLPDAELLDELIRYGGIPRELAAAPEVFELLLPALRADLRIVSSYYAEPSDGLHCPITAFGGIGDRFVPADVLARWAELTTGRSSRSMLPGGHFYLNSQCDQLLHAIRAGLLDDGAVNSLEPDSEEARA